VSQWVSQAALHPQVPTTHALCRAPMAERDRGHRWHSQRVGCCSSCSGAGLVPSPNLATAERDPTPRPPASPKELYPPPAQVAPTSSPGTGCLLLRAPVPHPGTAKAKKAQVEGRRWLRRLEGDGPSAMSPPRASPGYLHVERERPSSVQAEGAAIRVAGHRKAILRPPACAHQISP